MPTDIDAPARSMVRDYLREAHATELALAQTLTAHIAVTPRGGYRSLLEQHLAETRGHADRVRTRMRELDAGTRVVSVAVGALQSIVGQILAASKAPVDLLRGTSGEEKLLKNARDECATEALEIATYLAIEHLATAVDDRQTASLAAEIRADEEQMLAGLHEQIETLCRSLVAEQVGDGGDFDVTTTGLVDAARAGAATAGAVTRQAVETAQGLAGAAVAGGGDEDEAATGDEAEDETTSRQAGTQEAESDGEPWAGYDEQTAAEIVRAIADLDAAERREVRDYEGRTKGRKTVIGAAERDPE
ncbi:MAG: DUF892 family protein [Solirubrobacterales bacterium]